MMSFRSILSFKYGIWHIGGLLILIHIYKPDMNHTLIMVKEMVDVELFTVFMIEKK
jgi:hypothetical protein